MTPRRRNAVLVAVFTLAIFVNAALLFSVQPMFSKMVLPLLGGTPSVWNSCMLFFQVALLGGYLYAHLTTRALAPARQAALHLALLAAALLTLPVAVRAGWSPPTGGAPIPWLVGLLAVSLGLPFFALSAGAPLLQRWFASTAHPSASNPYFLYAASNLGSLVALLGYPLLVEPRLRLSEQSRAWSWGYWALALLVGACALLARRAAAAAPSGDGGRPAGRRGRRAADPAPARPALDRARPRAVEPPARRHHLRQHRRRGDPPPLGDPALALPAHLRHRLRDPAAGPALARGLAAARAHAPAGGVARLGHHAPALAARALHLTVFFVTALVCHGELARTRPPASQLTAFYLWISVGGALGGTFNVLVAPGGVRHGARVPARDRGRGRAAPRGGLAAPSGRPRRRRGGPAGGPAAGRGRDPPPPLRQA
jgi:hypothetical protein